MTDTRLCPMPHRDDKQRRAAASSQLCTSCGDRAAQQLALLPERYWDLLFAHSIAVGMQQRLSGSPAPGLRWSPDVTATRTAIEKFLISWAGIVVGERKLATPTTEKPALLAMWLARHLRWMLGTDDAKEFAANLAELSRESVGLCKPAGLRHIPVGFCAEQVDGARCPGRLTALLRDKDDVLPAAIYCAACGMEVPADRWLTYGRRLHTEQVA